MTATDSAADAGDEPLLLATSGAPVFVGEKRADAAAQLLAAHPGVDVIVADDGLQHYALARDVEIAVVDDGVGFTGGSPDGHFGLDQIRELAEETGGQIEIGSAPGAGTSVRARIPMGARVNRSTAQDAASPVQSRPSGTNPETR